MLCLTFSESGSYFLTQKFLKKPWKMAFLNAQYNRFLSSRPIQKDLLRNFLWPNFDFNSFERLALLCQKMLSTSSLKNLKKDLKMTISNAQKILFLSSRSIQKHFLRTLLWPSFDLNRFERFALPSQKMLSTSSLKNLQIPEYRCFETLRTFDF